MSPGGISPGFLFRVHEPGQQNAEEPVGVPDCREGSCMKTVVVVGTGRQAQVDLGFSSSAEGVKMVDFAVLRWDSTTRDQAAAVDGKDCRSHVVGEEPLFGAKVQDPALTVHDDGDCAAVA